MRSLVDSDGHVPLLGESEGVEEGVQSQEDLLDYGLRTDQRVHAHVLGESLVSLWVNLGLSHDQEMISEQLAGGLLELRISSKKRLNGNRELLNFLSHDW